MNANDEQLLTTADLARRLSIGQDKVRALARDGRIPCIEVDGCGLRFHWHEVESALRGGPGRITGAAPQPSLCAVDEHDARRIRARRAGGAE